MCRARKIKCDRRQPTCSNCCKAGARCNSSSAFKRVNHTKQLRDEFSNVLERLNDVDQTLSMLTQLTKEIASRPHSLDSSQVPSAAPTRPQSPNDQDLFLPSAFAELPTDGEDLESRNDRIYETVQLHFGGERIFGCTAPLTLIKSVSRKLAAHVRGKGDHEAEESGIAATSAVQDPMILAALRRHLEGFPFTGLHHESAFIVGDSRPITSPPRLLVDHFLDSFLRNINNFTPIFDEKSLRHSIDTHYSGESPSENDAWALILNNIAALGLSLEAQAARASQSSSRSMNEDIMPLFLRNCDRALAGLEPFKRPSIANIQALLTLALIARHFYSNVIFEKVCQTVCQAGRTMGLHRSGGRQSSVAGSAAEKERIFRVLYALDKQRVFMTGHPCDLYSFDSDLQFAQPTEEEPSNVRLHQAFSDMMRIWEEIYLRLYSSRAATAGAVHCARQVQLIGKLIDKWSQQHRGQLDAALVEPAPDLGLDQLELKYCYGVTQVLALRCDRGSERAQQQLLNYARSCLKLVAKVGAAPLNAERLASLARMLGNYPMVAFVDLLSHHLPTLLRDGSSDLPPEIRDDIELLKTVPTHIQALQHPDRSYSYFGRLYMGINWAVEILNVLQEDPLRPSAQSDSMRANLDMLMAQRSEEEGGQLGIELGEFGFYTPLTASLASTPKPMSSGDNSSNGFLNGSWDEVTSAPAIFHSEGGMDSDFYFRDMFVPE
ncbi:hypothetical protein DL771_006239 [Monosporascus sp. 5C6A]|nr:hypothetical protein DL771_006239 [Monosporascus sp. 5C6A]